MFCRYLFHIAHFISTKSDINNIRFIDWKLLIVQGLYGKMLLINLGQLDSLNILEGTVIVSRSYLIFCYAFDQSLSQIIFKVELTIAKFLNKAKMILKVKSHHLST